jgi:PAB-dependent poly(A)-specific ribonuclease subunit 3
MSSLHWRVAPDNQLDYHLYTSPLPHVSNGPTAQSGLHSFFISDDMRRMLQARQEAIYGGTASTAGLPHELLVYHSLYPLGISQDPVSKVYGLPTHVYRALNSVDGKTYCLRRIEGEALSHYDERTDL